MYDKGYRNESQRAAQKCASILYETFAEHGGNPGVFAEEMQKRGLPYRLLSMGGHMLL